MKRNLTAAIALGLCLWLSGEVSAGGPKPAVPRRGLGGSAITGAVPRGSGHRHWAPPVRIAPRYVFPGYRYDPYYYPYYFSNDPRSVVIVTPSAYDTPYTVLTSEPFYCHVHHVGFVSRAGFLDHISGAHKIPLETAGSICTDGNFSCIIEGY